MMRVRVLVCGALSHGLQLGGGVGGRARRAASTAVLSTAVLEPATSTRLQDRLAENLAVVEGLEPQVLWRRFAEIASIPRVSKHEEAVVAHIIGLAEARGLAWRRDAAGNLLVVAPGVGAGSAAAPVLIQGHVDMVTEKNSETAHDFLTEGIRFRRSGENVAAVGTTLGADNGIGCAAALALLDDPSPRPPLELLFTVDEETGLTGAKQLDAAALGIKSRLMLNLDTEEWGSVYAGCAGGGDSKITWEVARQPAAANAAALEISLRGLLGGHSGIDIGSGRCNAVVALARVCAAAVAAGAELSSFEGGEKHNAIPREAAACLVVPAGGMEAVVLAAEAAAEEVFNAYEVVETNMEFGFDQVADATDATIVGAATFLDMVLQLPLGALAMSKELEGLVETSNNVASVRIAEGKATVLCSTRSSVGSALDVVRQDIAAAANNIGAMTVSNEAYPGWAPNLTSPLLKLTQNELTKLLPGGQTAEVKAIHAGLECGLLIDRIDAQLDAVSFGPTITGAHSPDEAVDATTVPPFYALVQNVLRCLAEAPRA
ncbi:hypothetical protein M885DRAFT_615353 [Pelagophyceae sp. CCMP2097]|nr:hypothetical protein M885DRAFT_615353 [Pelagophyceae sp. CCMP2097]